VAYEGWSYEMNLWRLPVSGDSQGERVAPATDAWSFEPRYSPDGSRIAFISTRSGSYELWVAGRDGSAPQRLTTLGGPYVGVPRWSPDGGRLVFVARPRGRAELHLVDLAGGPVRRLPVASDDAVAPSFSADGAAVYYASRTTGAWQVHAVDLATRERRQVTRDGGYAALESRDGRWLYFSRVDARGLWRMRPRGGDASLITEDVRPEDWAAWGIADAGVYWLRPAPAEEPPRLLLSRPDAETPEPLARVPEMAWPGVELSPDGRDLLYARLGRRDSNLVLLRLGGAAR
jgi:Tol biopolymer transport system component